VHRRGCVSMLAAESRRRPPDLGNVDTGRVCHGAVRFPARQCSLVLVSDTAEPSLGGPAQDPGDPTQGTLEILPPGRPPTPCLRIGMRMSGSEILSTFVLPFVREREGEEVHPAIDLVTHRGSVSDLLKHHNNFEGKIRERFDREDLGDSLVETWERLPDEVFHAQQALRVSFSSCWFSGDPADPLANACVFTPPAMIAAGIQNQVRPPASFSMRWDLYIDWLREIRARGGADG